ncbi:MAG: TetR/AcrR family transcriptional regulator [Hydrogenophaga sp.]|uniref:TetR/AcrR family transcriptional regulator n=2 Tax=Hydrogenophaga sp. TaxID=1904254 RepID=UPI0027353F84|nr:TetR/AcrR family transcriptional regulator [Hydrogenophaga sp.]MDP3348267.1 helix-turn-helix domain-containing protein [Hydrogenophaga sp.]
MSTLKPVRSDGRETKVRMKAVAQRLFAQHGIDGVTVADIVAAAGQRNKASLQYHFGSKDELIGELLVDGAQKVDAFRLALLDQMAEDGGPRHVRDVLDAFVRPVYQLTVTESEGSTYLRFLSNVQLTHRELFRAHIGAKWNTGYRRCLEHFRQLLAHIPAPVLEQRMSLVAIYTTTVFSIKEAPADDAPASSRIWTHKFTLDNILDTFEAMLVCVPSAGTLEKLK